MIRTNDTTVFSEETSGCNGSLTSVVLAASCSFSKYKLELAPYNLVWGTSVYV
jgi:hypothetical protein